jgi:hypothetical protein
MYSQSFMWKFARSNTVGSFSKLSESLACGKSQVELLIHPQRERLPQFKIRILMINKVEPTVVIPTEVRLIIRETESIESAGVHFARDPDGYEIFIP